MGLASFHRPLGSLEALGSAPTVPCGEKHPNAGLVCVGGGRLSIWPRERMRQRSPQVINNNKSSSQVSLIREERVKWTPTHRVHSHTLSPRILMAIIITSIPQVRRLELQKQKPLALGHTSSEGQLEYLILDPVCYKGLSAAQVGKESQC